MSELIPITKAQILIDLEFAITSKELDTIEENYQSTANWYQGFWQAIEHRIEFFLEPDLRVPKRLGLYFEWLWLLAIKAHPHYQLITHNLQLNEKGRTLGSLDFLVEDQRNQTLEHWELACKFYLAFEWQQQWHWLGPNLNDAWQLKKHRLLSHQIQLSETTLAKKLFQNLGIATPTRQRIILKGKIFWPESEQNQQRHWLTFSNWRQSGRSGLIQPKQFWLGEKYASDKELEKETPLQKATLMLEQHQQYFVVPDSWPTQAIDALSHLVKAP